MKVHKGIPKFKITEYDVDMVAEKVQEHTTYSWDDAEKQREEIIQKLIELKDTLAQLQLSEVQYKDKVKPQHTIKEDIIPTQETVQIIASRGENVCITQKMLHMDDETTQK